MKRLNNPPYKISTDTDGADTDAKLNTDPVTNGEGKVRRGKFRRSNGKKTFGIRSKLFIWPSIFTLIIIFVLWLCQVVFLDTIYKGIKVNEIRHAAKAIESALGDENFESTAENIATKNDICMIVLQMVSDDRALQLCSVESQSSCLIHNAEKSSIFVFYNTAVQNGGSSVQRFRYSTERRVYVSSESEYYDSLSAENESIIYSVVVTDSSDLPVLILLNAVISPVTATVNTLNKMLIAISAALLFFALIMAVIISRRISKPIVSLTDDAKKLAGGDYNVKFSASDFREIGELASALDYAKHELSKVDALRRDLIANISHDLRTPLTMISGYAEVMRDLPGENTAENLQVIIDESNRLTTLVNDVLDISKLESGVWTVSPSEFSLTDAISSAIKSYNKLTERGNYKIIFRPEYNVTVNTDKTILMQVFYNLLGNAVTYTGDDKTVYVSQSIDSETRNVRITVTDTGDGIAPEKLPLIWDRYYKVDKIHRRASVGTGLGLSIVRGSMELLGGGYGVKSTPGAGSDFWFELPYTKLSEYEYPQKPDEYTDN